MAYTIPFYSSTTSRFGETAGRTNPHRGHDVAPGGLAFPSWVNGVVVTAGWQSCLGNRVVVRNSADGYFIGVSHLATISVSVGQQVRIGTTLGVIGNTGSCSAGRHAHITVSPTSPFPESGAVIDPVRYAASSGSSTAGGGGGVDYAFGLTTEAMKAMQGALTRLKLYTLAVDGVFGEGSVKAMQQYLKNKGLLPGDYAVDGIPGPKYGAALQTLAKDFGYGGVIDGEPGTQTSLALVKWANSITGTGSTGTGDAGSYGYGLTTEAQRESQEALTKLKLYTGKVDGVFGPLSVSAFQQYLKNIGLLPGDYGVDGEPGQNYGIALQKLAAKFGYTGAIDGIPGEATSAGIVKWANSIQGTTTPVPETPPQTGGKWPTAGAFGIDVASPQRDIDFAKAKADGVQFAIVKMGGLNVTPQYVAPHYVNQINRARAAGLKIGHYYLIGLGQTPEQQARYFVENAHDFRVDQDVLALDNEKLDDNGVRWNDAEATRFVNEVIRLTGISPKRVWHYSGASDYRTHRPWPGLEAAGVRYWWAAYGANNGTRDHEPSLDGSIPRFDVHQFSSLTAIAGYQLDGNWSPHTVDTLFAKGTVVTQPDPDPDPEPTVDRLPEFLVKLTQFIEDNS